MDDILKLKLIKNESALKLLRNKYKHKKIVLLNGSFDLLHIGHLEMFSYAARLGDIVLVLVNTDKSIQRYKGKYRPIQNQGNRTKALAALSFVNYIYLFSEDTPKKYFDIIKPDVYLLGSDWNGVFIGKDVLEKVGTKIVVDKSKVFSTTSLLEKLKNIKNSKRAIFYFDDKDIKIVKKIEVDFIFKLNTFNKEKIFKLCKDNDIALNNSFVFSADLNIIKKAREINLRDLTI